MDHFPALIFASNRHWNIGCQCPSGALGGQLRLRHQHELAPVFLGCHFILVEQLLRKHCTQSKGE
jgi:hypothetical protein